MASSLHVWNQGRLTALQISQQVACRGGKPNWAVTTKDWKVLPLQRHISNRKEEEEERAAWKRIVTHQRKDLRQSRVLASFRRRDVLMRELIQADRH